MVLLGEAVGEQDARPVEDGLNVLVEAHHETLIFRPGGEQVGVQDRRPGAERRHGHERLVPQGLGADRLASFVVEVNALAVHPAAERARPLPEVGEDASGGQPGPDREIIAVAPQSLSRAVCGSCATDWVWSWWRSADCIVSRPRARLMSAFGTQ